MNGRRALGTAALLALGLALGAAASARLRPPAHGDATSAAAEEPASMAGASAAVPDRGRAGPEKPLPPPPPRFVAQAGSAPAERSPRMRFEEIPSHLKSAVLAKAAGRRLKTGQVEKRVREDGQIEYAVDVDIAGVNHRLALDESGRVLGDESEVGLGETPPAVVRHLGEAIPGSVVLQTTKIEESNQTSYRVKIRAAGAVTELRLKDTGELLSSKPGSR